MSAPLRIPEEALGDLESALIASSPSRLTCLHAALYFDHPLQAWRVVEISARGWFMGFVSSPIAAGMISAAQTAVIAYAKQQAIDYSLTPLFHLRLP